MFGSVVVKNEAYPFLKLSRDSANRNSFSSYEKGISAELCAEKILKSKGYEVIGKRVRNQYGEIDLLVENGPNLVAVEVKQRKTLAEAKSCISMRQQRRILKALMLIVSNRDEIFENYRVDVVCLDSVGRFEHIENAFQTEALIAD